MIQDLSREFLVSIDVVSTRIIELNLWDIAIIYWKPMCADRDGHNYSITRTIGQTGISKRSARFCQQCARSIHETYTKNIHTTQLLDNNLQIESFRRKSKSGLYVFSILHLTDCDNK